MYILLLLTSMAREKFLNIFFCTVREKIMTVPRKKTQRESRRLEKAEKAAQLDKVIFADNPHQLVYFRLLFSNICLLLVRVLKVN